MRNSGYRLHIVYRVIGAISAKYICCTGGAAYVTESQLYKQAKRERESLPPLRQPWRQTPLLYAPARLSLTSSAAHLQIWHCLPRTRSLSSPRRTERSHRRHVAQLVGQRAQKHEPGRRGRTEALPQRRGQQSDGGAGSAVGRRGQGQGGGPAGHRGRRRVQVSGKNDLRGEKRGVSVCFCCYFSFSPWFYSLKSL